MKRKILIVEDDPHILLGLEEVLKLENFDIKTCNRGDTALEEATAFSPDLVVLDVMLPGLSGFEVCKAMRARSAVLPILMLTAKGQELDKVLGLGLGADDYMTKPFGLRELIARIQALLRRANNGKPIGSEAAKERFSIGGCEIDPKTFQLLRGKDSEELTAKELKLLQFFHEHPSEVLSRDRLLNEVWGYNYYGTTRTLDQVIVQLRKKLNDTAEHPRHLVTVHGVGYKYTPERH
jgi:DNA-binding response OmpR family regulator